MMSANVILVIAGDRDYISDAYDHIYSTYYIDKKMVTKRMMETMYMRYLSKDKAACCVPIYPSKNNKLNNERIKYIMDRWDVCAIISNKPMNYAFLEGMVI